jgi:DNA mismatch endonuclease (patch repair protein)
MAVRRELHRRGLRYRVASKVLPDARRTVDIAFPKKKIAVLIDGCFWHGCAEHYRPSHKNAAFWEAKVRETMRRDKDTAERLAGAGWTVVRFWEHESAESVADQVEALVRSASA